MRRAIKAWHLLLFMIICAIASPPHISALSNIHRQKFCLFFLSSPSSGHQLLHPSYILATKMSEVKLDQDSTDASTTAPTQAEEPSKGTAPAATSYTEMASNAAGSATTAAVGVKDSVFSMFGGGAKKEKKEEPEGEVEDRSGSSKAKKDAEAAEGDEGGEVGLAVLLFPISSRVHKDANCARPCLVGRRSRIPGCSLRARRTFDRKGRDQDERGG